MTRTPALAAPLWSARDARFAHRGAARAALDGVSLDVPAGGLTALLGPNGAGKSTLLALLLGTARPHGGTVTFRGHPASDWPRAGLARTVGVVPQGEEFAFPLTVRALVEMGRYPHLGPWQRAGRADHDAVDAALARCGLADLADRAVGTLSGGERQRARLARALAQVASPAHGGAPPPGAALALDEPTAALDLAHEMAFFGLARELAHAGTTVLLVTHNLNLAARYADHLVLLAAGRVAAAGAPAEVLAADVVSRVYGWPVAVRPYAGPGPARGAPQIVPLDPALADDPRHASSRAPRGMTSTPTLDLPTSVSNVRPCLGIALGATAAIAAPAAAQRRPDGAAADSARRVAPVVTTATRAPARADELPQRVTTITRADLERTPVVDAVDALKKLAGVDVIQYPSLLGYVSVRGFRPSSSTQTRTLVLIDGRPAGAYNLSLVDVNAIERIEVLKGPASAVYGSSAVGGVVNLITRRTAGRPAGTVSAAYGTFATSELTARGGGVLARPGGHAIDADATARRYAQGQNYRIGRGGAFRSAVGGETATKIYTGTTRPSREVSDTAGDGVVRDFSTFTSTSGSARVGVALPAAFRLDVRGERFDAADVLAPGDVYARLSNSPGNSRKNVARHTEDVTLRRDPPAEADGPTARLVHAPLARVYTAYEVSESFDQPGEAGFVSFAGWTRTSGAQLQDVVRLGAQSLTIGLDATRIDERSRRYARSGTTVDEIGTFSPNSRQTSTAAFAQAQLRSPGGRVTGVVGGRLDRVTLDLRETPFRTDVTPGSDGFTVFNPNVGVQAELGAGLRLHATAGRAFLNPSANGLAGFSESVTNDVAAITVGNPGLRPEHSVTVDGGLALSLPSRRLALDVTYFATTTDDRISTARATFAAGRRPTTAAGRQVSSITTSFNAGDARVRGLEADARYDLGRALRRAFSLSVFASGTRIFRAEETTPRVTVDTAGIAAAQSLDARAVFGRVRLDDSRSTTLRIKNVATFTGTAGLDFDDFRRFTGRVGARYVGRRLDSDFSDASDPGDIEYAPFLVLDLTAGVRLAGRYRVEGLVSNLTDENYYEKRGYNLPGRALRLRVAADF